MAVEIKRDDWRAHHLIPYLWYKDKDADNMKCVTCSEEAEYISGGYSLCEKHYKEREELFEDMYQRMLKQRIY